MSPLHDLSTDDLVTRARRGCRESFGQLVERNVKGVYNFLIQRTGSHEDAEELSQECFLRAWRKLGTYRDEWSFSTWVRSIARSLAADRARARRLESGGAGGAASARGVDGVEIEQQAPAVAPAPELDERDEGERLWRCAREVLDGDQHSALWLHYAEDRSAAEIGAILGRSPLAVRLLMFRARSTLRAHLDRIEARGSAPSALVLGSPMETAR